MSSSDSITIPKKGKAYANRKSADIRPLGDYYCTPMSLVWVARDVILREFPTINPILEPCAGEGAISRPLSGFGYSVYTNDLFHPCLSYSLDYLQPSELSKFCYVVTNPPFSLWDDFVNRAKTHCDKFMFIGRLNYFGTKGRNAAGLWSGLKAIYAFNQYVDYQTPFRTDGLYHVGAMATAWFLWERGWTPPPTFHILDVSEYAKLGPFRKLKSSPHP
jgi:hypothetical protein